MGKAIIWGALLGLAGCVQAPNAPLSAGSQARNPTGRHFAGGPAEQRTAAAIARIGQVDRHLHAVIAVDPSAMAQARSVDASGVAGPLAGQPVLLKDNIEAAGPLPT